MLTAIYWYATVQSGLMYRDEDPRTVRCFLIRGLTIPVIFLLSIGVSYFSVSVAIWSWVVLIVVDAVILRRRHP
jgi:TMEM175 potassium channel family protein